MRFFRYCKTFIFFVFFSALLVGTALFGAHLLTGKSGDSLFVLKSEKYLCSSSDFPLTVVLDAGHGGIDGGAVSDDGLILEKDLNLAVAKKLAELLSLSGVKVVMTRTEDVLLSEEGTGHRKRDDLLARKKIAESEKNVYFVSIHMNKFPVAKYSGLQVYYSPNNPDSETLAEALQTRVKEILQPTNTREIKKADSSIFLLSSLQIPAVLVECGFLSNPEEAEKLCDPVYQQELAAVLYAALLDALPAAP